MREIEFQILKFLLEGKAYSDNAVRMNFGLDDTALEEVYSNLYKEGYIETYAEYEKRTSEENKKSGKEKSCGCSEGGCNSGNDGGKCCSQDSWNYEKVWVLTEKANGLIF